MTDTKKLNAGIALVCLGSYLEDGMITQEQFERIRVLADRGKNTLIAKESETNDVEYIEQSIASLPYRNFYYAQNTARTTWGYYYDGERF